MPIVDIPVNGPVYQNVDETGLIGLSALLYDGYIDDLGHTNSRPGTSLLVNISSKPLQGIKWWPTKHFAIAVAGGRIYKILDATGTYVDITGIELNASNKISFAIANHAGVEYLFMANGGRIMYTDGTMPTQYIASANAPTLVNSIAYIDGYLLAQIENTETFGHSETGEALTWNGSIFTAETRKDLLIGIDTSWSDIMLFGTDSVEVWYNNGSDPFARRDFIESGCGAPHTVALGNNTWYYLDNHRRFVSLDGRFPKVHSTPFDALLQNLDTVSDANGYILRVVGREFYVIQFPTANKCYVYNIAANDWSEWTHWNTVQAIRDRFIGAVYAYATDWNLLLLGSYKTGDIHTMNNTLNADEGVLRNVVRTTGFMDHGTSAMKRANKLIIRIKRGAGTGAYAPTMTVRWRDDGQVGWHEPVIVDMGLQGDGEFFIQIDRLGMYRARQYEFTLTGDVPLILVGAQEQHDILRF